MEDLVAQLTQALMLHAIDLSAITNSQVMVVVETPSGADCGTTLGSSVCPI